MKIYITINMCWSLASLECFEEFSGLQQCLSYVPMREGRGGAEAASSPAGEGFLAATAAGSAAGAWQCMTSRVDTKKQVIY